MRRSSLGVKTKSELIPALILEAERHDPKRTIALLEPLVSQRRREKIVAILSHRIGSVSVLFDAPHDPHNGAAVIRSCEAFGVQGLHVVERDKPFLSSETVTRGADKWIDVHTYPNADAATARLLGEGYTLVAAHPEGELVPNDLADAGKITIVLGNEHAGIAGDLVAHCTKRVRVPMRGFVESLNVSVTAAILLQAATWGRPGDLSVDERERLYARGLYLSMPHAADVLKP